MAENRETVFPGFEIRDGVLKEYTGAGGIVRVPDGVLTIEKNVFSNREDISSVVLPEGLQIIRDNLFSGTGSRTCPWTAASCGRTLCPPPLFRIYLIMPYTSDE